MKTLYKIIFIVLIPIFINEATANSCPPNKKYAQKPDGCSSWSNNGRQVRDSWGPVNFTPACNKHDICYYTLGTSEASCNNAFLKNLKDECQYGLRRFPDPARMSICLGIATTMYTGVRAASRSVYRKAQKKQRKHENNCRQNNGSSQSYSRSRFGKYGIRISQEEAIHWDHHLSNVGKNEWNQSFHKSENQWGQNQWGHKINGVRLD